MKKLLSGKLTKVVVFLICLLPLARLLCRGFHQDLGANPVEFIQRDLGDWTLIFLALTLAISPARKLLKQPQLIRFRRMLGLFAFFYVFLHFTTYIWLDQQFDFRGMIKDVAKRPFITAGFTGFVLLIPLAITSTAGWIRRLGGRRWQMLHRLIYLTAIAGVIHYYWLVKSDVRKPVAYGLLFAILLGYRVVLWFSARRRTPGRAPIREELTTAENA